MSHVLQGTLDCVARWPLLYRPMAVANSVKALHKERRRRAKHAVQARGNAEADRRRLFVVGPLQMTDFIRNLTRQ